MRQPDAVTAPVAGSDTIASGADAGVSDSAKRQQIMEGARRVFLEHGFDGASIGDIVRSAGISKGTLYAYFPSKEKLFVALVFENRRRQAERVFQLDHADADVADVLRRLGLALARVMTSPESVALLRLVIGAAPKFPEAGRAFFDAGPAYGIAQLADYLDAQVRAGRLTIDRPKQAAAQFLELCKVGLLQPMLMASEPPPAESVMQDTIDAAVTLFMTCFSPAHRFEDVRHTP
jgi:AcrR family transcriptional regulator